MNIDTLSYLKCKRKDIEVVLFSENLGKKKLGIFKMNTHH